MKKHSFPLKPSANLILKNLYYKPIFIYSNTHKNDKYLGLHLKIKENHFTLEIKDLTTSKELIFGVRKKDKEIGRIVNRAGEAERDPG